MACSAKGIIMNVDSTGPSSSVTRVERHTIAVDLNSRVVDSVRGVMVDEVALVYGYIQRLVCRWPVHRPQPEGARELDHVGKEEGEYHIGMMYNMAYLAWPK